MAVDTVSAPRTTPHGSLPSNTRYRTSCDRCQDAKLKCSQDKPACIRCAKKGLGCLYSPLRRVGRPKKAEQAPRQKARSAFPRASSSSQDASRSAGFDSGGETVDFGSSSIGTPLTGPSASAMDYERTATQTGTPSEHYTPAAHSALPSGPSPSSWAPTHGLLPTTQGMDAWPPIPVDTRSQLQGTSTDPASQYRGTHSNSGERGSEVDCSVAITSASAYLEATLAQTTHGPPVDIILSAERNVRSLQSRLAGCRGHAAGRTQSGCLHSNRPVLLQLGLLAERVVGTLEQIFQQAAKSRTAIEWPIQDGDSLNTSPSGSSVQRRLERSFRGLLDQPCVFPAPQANLDFRIGDYTVDGPVKARAVKRIIQLRVRKLLAALQGLRQMQQEIGVNDPSGGVLDWGDSRSVLKVAAGKLVDDLVRRMEALQGAMALMS